ncbi:hypothetical protein ACFPL7_23525 [Dongia soli]|uniref:Uncharacterized protein n=1 Tax=Dongia soli TaxID=600628 RepID=A0ABU5EIL9_9PROT|nr:hypothetical protein [Dongia soli]MDY0885654.1 hypothetical protein [Dongia soli]
MSVAGFLSSLPASPVSAASLVSCGGAVMMNAAELLCSHLDPHAPPQLCSYSWALLKTDSSTKVAQGSFLLPPGVANMQIYAANGFLNALSPPIIMCQQKPAGDGP